MSNRRLDKRIYLKTPITVKAKIHEFQNEEVLSDRYTLFTVENISLNGLRLISNLDFPITDKMILSLEVPLFARKNVLLGIIVWKRRKGKKIIYGFKIKSTNIGYIQAVAQLTKGSPKRFEKLLE